MVQIQDFSVHPSSLIMEINLKPMISYVISSSSVTSTFCNKGPVVLKAFDLGLSLSNSFKHQVEASKTNHIKKNASFIEKMSNKVSNLTHYHSSSIFHGCNFHYHSSIFHLNCFASSSLYQTFIWVGTQNRFFSLFVKGFLKQIPLHHKEPSVGIAHCHPIFLFTTDLDLPFYFALRHDIQRKFCASENELRWRFELFLTQYSYHLFCSMKVRSTGSQVSRLLLFVLMEFCFRM